tara:strand:- start:4265 stop:4654 length:390 start_codon:yes stop_codon:yes gene_type:complete
MREIKFRAWWSSKEHKNKKGREPCMLFVGDDLGTKSPFDCCRYADEGQHVTLMQYTGLKDSNGVEIYEGDILATEGEYRFVVKFGGGSFCIQNITKWVSPWVPMRGIAMDRYSVVGNIYENPELVEGDL